MDGAAIDTVIDRLRGYACAETEPGALEACALLLPYYDSLIDAGAAGRDGEVTLSLQDRGAAGSYEVIMKPDGDLRHGGSVTDVAVDLRYNPGGNPGFFTRDILPRLSRLRGQKRIWALAGPRTRSSAIIALLELKGSCGATFVGRPTSEGAASYGEVKAFTLPNSKFSFTTSSSFFELMPGSVEGTPIQPDVRVGEDYASFSAGRDVALECILGAP